MWAFLMAAVAAAATPSNIRLDDIEKWEAAAEQLLDMPPGCWEWVGQASWDWHTGKYGKTRGDAVFAGKTNDGTWGEIALQPLGELQQRTKLERESKVYANKARFVPMVGRLPGGRVLVAGQDEDADTIEDTEALNVLRQVLGRIGGEAFTSWAEWDDTRGGVVLHRAIPLASNRKEEVKVDIFFPNGEDVPSLLDVRFPAKFKAALRKKKGDNTQLGRIRMGLFAWTIRDAEVHVRGLIRGNVVYPSSEAFRLKFGFLGFKYHGAQTVVYKKITRCKNQPIPEEGVSAPPAAEAMVQAGGPPVEVPEATPEAPDAAVEAPAEANDATVEVVTPAPEPTEPSSAEVPVAPAEVPVAPAEEPPAPTEPAPTEPAPTATEPDAAAPADTAPALVPPAETPEEPPPALDAPAPTTPTEISEAARPPTTGASDGTP